MRSCARIGRDASSSFLNYMHHVRVRVCAHMYIYIYLGRCVCPCVEEYWRMKNTPNATTIFPCCTMQLHIPQQHVPQHLISMLLLRPKRQCVCAEERGRMRTMTKAKVAILTLTPPSKYVYIVQSHVCVCVCVYCATPYINMYVCIYVCMYVCM